MEIIFVDFRVGRWLKCETILFAVYFGTFKVNIGLLLGCINMKAIEITRY